MSLVGWSGKIGDHVRNAVNGRAGHAFATTPPPPRLLEKRRDRKRPGSPPHSDTLLPRATHQFTRRHPGCSISTRPFHHCRTKKVRPLLRLCARPLIVLLSTLAYRLPPSFLPSTPVLFDSPFTPLCQSWQVTNQRSPPRQTYRPSCQLSTRCVRPPTTHVNAALTTDFPVLQLPILYVVRLSISPTDIHKPLIDPPHPSPTDRRLRRCHLRCVEHTSCQEPDQPI